MTGNDKFIGTWQLLSMVNESDSVENHLPFGKNVSGLLIYTEDGYMSAQLGQSGRNKFISSDFRYGTKDEIFSAFNGYISYFGTYEIDEAKSLVVHDVQMSMYPNWEGTRQKRYFSFKNDLLILKATPVLFNEQLYTPTLTWQKV